MGDHENVAAVRRLYQAFGAGDLDTVRSVFAPDVVWHEQGSHAFAGDHHGLEGVLGVNQRAAEMVGGAMSLDVHDVVGNDRHVVILQRVTAKRDGAEHRLDEVIVAHMDAGVIREVWVSYPDPRALQALFG